MTLERRPPGDELVGEDSPPAAPAPVRAYQAIPYKPARSAMRDEAGRRIVGAVWNGAAALAPGVLFAGAVALGVSKARDAWRAWEPPWRKKTKSDGTIEVRLVEMGRRVGTRERMERVVVDEPAPEPAPPPMSPEEEKLPEACATPPQSGAGVSLRERLAEVVIRRAVVPLLVKAVPVYHQAVAEARSAGPVVRIRTREPLTRRLRRIRRAAVRARCP